ncbi:MULTISPECIES: hypothetical protein [Vibrio]|uniref:hypothetical protein n=1 Tax=Vibrio TaxID=662 RepID=UPI000B8EDCF4|nr:MULTISPECIES: hypothetical protein [Vibrio]OXX29103.1 hypothetical protein B9J92_02420 [Vibrio sp. V08_P9A1T1]OXX73288.1 hypothetical protein B9J87_06285 [Vibrio sp. V19_P1S1T109]TYC93826.1 hypothetical protein FXB64_05380 [Vibrio anguillarum]TYC97379.1 hypothetical protein FXB62_03955 [Vibrio anguillarum]
MQYAAVMLCADGGIVRHEETFEPANVQVGDFESMDAAIDQACLDLNCTHLHKGVISKGKNKGGFMVVTTQELGEV